MLFLHWRETVNLKSFFSVILDWREIVNLKSFFNVFFYIGERLLI
jgi:hypothetical protein